ncbi:MAG: putative rane protein [Symbiobacteriaceae bacterium]|jgi:uncharacterized membrane protein YcaP (DUF421 family)|nr:putative rane protein [Symbiobacteriaceae bacterium]
MNEGFVVGVRAAISFISLLVYTNILGKQQVGQLTFFDFSTAITIGNLAGALTTDFDSRAWPHFVGLTLWALMALGAQWVALKSRWWARLIGGEPTILIQNGHILERNMRGSRYRYDDLLMQLRERGVFDLSEVEFAVLEPNGQLSVLKRSQYQPVTPHDLGIPTAYKGLGTMLIHDGTVLKRDLKEINLSEAWLAHELGKRGIESPHQVSLAILSTTGSLFVDRFEDHVRPASIDDEMKVQH